MPNLLPRTGLQTSARNQFDGLVGALTAGPVNCEVRLQLPGGDALTAVITQAAARELGLAVGGRAVAIVKAPWVIVATAGADSGADAGLRDSARNQLSGTVSALTLGPVNAEVAITLPGGSVVHAVITQEAVADLGLAVGQAARAIIKASHIVLAA
ncbi:TOBE domain-containing protein [Aquabacterium sp. OR-4]|uniref:TOBE domain-containing protein n=1 Tax=Aquabacterium sp. OR-4 TaxID=2978127 RepID=UPI0021B182EE|nr:TOBE domain-containing protein [Aquabacterium sp. OR-4]MDT7834221.1 TOBE domain-containing protein [Aquabacterium sp. OR-4]